MSNVPARRAESRSRAGGAEELHDHGPCADSAESLDVASELGEPDGQLAAERDRHRRLRVGPARHHRRAVRVGLRRDFVSQRVHEDLDPVERTTEEQREAGVHDVLRCRAPVDIAGRLGRGVPDLLEQRQDRIADDERPFAKDGELDSIRCGGGLDGSRGIRGDDPEAGLRLGERPLDLEPGGHERFLREELCDLVVAEHVDERQEHRYRPTRWASM